MRYTFEEAWYCVRVTTNSETSPKLLLISFLSGSDIWAALKIPRQRLLLINACTAERVGFNIHSAAYKHGKLLEECENIWLSLIKVVNSRPIAH